MTSDPSPLHGQGGIVPWQVEEASSTDAILVYRHEAGEWPWHYEARQEFALGEQGLHATLCCRNVSDRPMPCGLGFHPHFPCSTGTLLQTAVSHVWTIDENVLPVERVAATGRSEEHTSELQSLMRISYAVFCLKKNNHILLHHHTHYYPQ